MSVCNVSEVARSRRDARVDVLRGAALLMIFVDHLPGNPPALLTLHNFGFCDAAKVFVLLAGVSTMMAYGKLFARDGARVALRRIAARCLRIYLYQAALLLTTVIVVLSWTRQFNLKPTLIAPILDAGLVGLAHGLLLHALPGYLDILPLYIVLLAIFPLLYYAMRWRVWLGVAGSALVWGAANLDHRLTLPNWLDAKGWYFNPFTWQMLFALGAAIAIAMARTGGALPVRRWLVAVCALYLAFALLQTAPWTEWGFQAGTQPWRLITMDPPDKSHLSPLRLLDILALFYLLFSLPGFRRVADHAGARALAACGRHSLEIFAFGCLLALFGRLIFRTWGRGWPLVTAVNATGLIAMCALALWLERPPIVRAPAPAAAR